MLAPGRLSAAFGLLLVVTCSFAFGQIPDSQMEKKVIDAARLALISRFDKRLPRVTLEYFLLNEAGARGRLTWERNDCGEQTGSADVDRARDFPICAEAKLDLSDGRQVSVMIAVGTLIKGISGAPGIWSISLRERDGRNNNVGDLSQLSAAIHRRHSPNHSLNEKPF